MTNADKQSPTTYIHTFILCLVKKKAAPPQIETTPENASQVQPVVVDADSTANAGSIVEFDDNEHNRQVLDELFELLLEVPLMNGEYISYILFLIKYLMKSKCFFFYFSVLFCSFERCWCPRWRNWHAGKSADPRNCRSNFEIEETNDCNEAFRLNFFSLRRSPSKTSSQQRNVTF